MEQMLRFCNLPFESSACPEGAELVPNVRYIEYTGDERVVDVPSGVSVMEGAVQNSVTGIDGDCGGCCACATCHVYVDPQWADRLPAREEMETEMLELAEEVRSNSRLACQIVMSDALDGLVVRLPESQH